MTARAMRPDGLSLVFPFQLSSMVHEKAESVLPF